MPRISLTFGRDLVHNPSRAHDLLVRLFPTDRGKNLACVVWGVLSGFPLCCVWFCVTKWRPLGYAQGFDAAWERWPQGHVGHVECEGCRASR